jgi:selenide, water dikinase
VELGQVLEALPPLTDPNVLVGAGTGDDAAVYRIAPDRALVATVDFFTPIVDDPAAYGAIAAANSLSDVYAMGATPLFALSIVGFPRDRLDTGLLAKIVAGGAAKLAEAGVPVVGGHSVDDSEPKFGYAVTGEVNPDRMVTNQGAQPGDVLFLSKPLGTGLVATAIKRGLCPEHLADAAIALMKQLNRDASLAMLEAGATAATDVTGYGLLGHLRNFGVGAEIESRAVPYLFGVRELAGDDLFPAGSRRNHAALAGIVEWGGLPEVEQLLLCDAQTSGGLLVAIPPASAGTFRAACPKAVEIGRVTADGRLRIRP